MLMQRNIFYFLQAMLIAVFVCRIPSLGVLDEAEIMHYVFLLFPTYA